MAFEKLLARLTAQSSGPNPKQPGGGKPKYTVADISLIASAAPHPSFHVMMAKWCDDPRSLHEVRQWVHRVSCTEWFSNPDYASIRVTAEQLNGLADLAVVAWLQPRADPVATIKSRAAAIGMNHQTYRTNLQPHFAFLVGELQFQERIGISAISGFLKDPDP